MTPRVAAASVALACALTGVRCSAIDCGPGTIERDGACVLLVSQGTTCGTGTQLVSGQCVPEPTGCAPDSVRVSGACVPIATCGAGTVFDAGTRSCVVSGGARCGEGTASFGTSCRPAAYVQLVNDIDVDGVVSLDFTIDGTMVASALAYGHATPYLPIVAAEEHTIRVTANGAEIFTRTFAGQLNASIIAIAAGIPETEDGNQLWHMHLFAGAQTAPPGSSIVPVFNGVTGLPAFALVRAMSLTGQYEEALLNFGDATEPAWIFDSTMSLLELQLEGDHIDGVQSSSDAALLPVPAADAGGRALLVIAAGRATAIADIRLYGVLPEGGAFLPLDAPAALQIVNYAGASADGDCHSGLGADVSCRYHVDAAVMPIVSGINGEVRLVGSSATTLGNFAFVRGSSTTLLITRDSNALDIHLSPFDTHLPTLASPLVEHDMSGYRLAIFNDATDLPAGAKLEIDGTVYATLPARGAWLTYGTVIPEDGTMFALELTSGSGAQLGDGTRSTFTFQAEWLTTRPSGSDSVPAGSNGVLVIEGSATNLNASDPASTLTVSVAFDSGSVALPD